MQTKRILVTGKKGDVSLYIANWLSHSGHQVENISLRGQDWKEAAFSDYDVIVHVAGVVPKEGMSAETFYAVNSELTKAVAEKAKREGVGHFIYISSMAVYGKTPQLKTLQGRVTAETPCCPTTDYGKSKLLGETYLRELEDTNFTLTIIRVPSVYGKGKVEYLEQYRHLNKKFGRVPLVYRSNYKSIICLDNLSELIRLLIVNKQAGTICPDDGKYSAVDICVALDPKLKKSKMLGLLLKMVGRRNLAIKNYFGAVYYSEELTQVFEGAYRVQSLEKFLEGNYLEEKM